MDREKFNSLNIENQVSYFNQSLSSGDNFNAICKRIGVSKNTIKKRFLENKYNEIKQGQLITGYIKDEEEFKAPIKKENQNNKANIESIVNRLEVLEKELKELKDSNRDLKNNGFIINNFNNGTITKTLKIDEEVNKKLDKIIEEYSMCKKQDIISSLLNYAINNIK